tara:strand:+ start:1298 stop:1732 length:435 start_codon:yes stop_codon:yes gene_type:complete
MINIYTDGSCVTSTRKGGWGVFIQYDNNEFEYYGQESETTNNRMEIYAVIRALEIVKDKFSSEKEINIYIDSNYVVKGITEWLPKWKLKNWKTTARKNVLNKDLWIQIDSFSPFENINFIWIKAHNSNYGNEKADFLSKNYMIP